MAYLSGAVAVGREPEHDAARLRLLFNLAHKQSEGDGERALRCADVLAYFGYDTPSSSALRTNAERVAPRALCLPPSHLTTAVFPKDLSPSLLELMRFSDPLIGVIFPSRLPICPSSFSASASAPIVFSEFSVPDPNAYGNKQK